LEKEKKRINEPKKIPKLGTITIRATIRIVEKHVKAQFIVVWIPITIKEVNDRFH
jgi:hypothetical protein